MQSIVLLRFYSNIIRSAKEVEQVPLLCAAVRQCFLTVPIFPQHA
jgi:hypothetical protein